MLSTTAELMPPAELHDASQRMLGLTGFVTVLHPPHDRRARVFSRYHHVRRVAWTAEHLASSAQSRAPLNQWRLRWLAWAHDLNRWPFAHNSEKGQFDQASDLPRYLRATSIDADDALTRELQAVVDKRHEVLGPEGAVVLLADMLTGFIEDPLWLVAVLNVTPEVIPGEVARFLGFDVNDPALREELADLTGRFVPGCEPLAFVDWFDALFTRLMANFVRERRLDRPGVLGSAAFERQRQLVKEHFMRGVVFPFNNERVSGGARIKREIVSPLLDALGVDATPRLTRLTDAGCMDLAVKLRVLGDADRGRFRPRLDYMQHEEPERSFTAFLARRGDDPPTGREGGRAGAMD